MTNEELLQKMEEDMKLRNFSKYSFYTYSHKAYEMIKYFEKTMEQVTTDEMRAFLIKLKEERHLANKNELSKNVEICHAILLAKYYKS